MTQATASSVKLTGALKRYGSTTALDAVDLAVANGELVALLGASGSGKTTLLRAIAGLIQLDGGSVHIGSEDVTRVPTQRRPIGMVFQSYALFPNLDVARNIGFALSIRKMPKLQIAARVEELLDLVGLAGLGGRFPTQLSGGQQQRVALARALAPEPRVLLLDEPLSALDAVIRTTLRDEIRRIQQRVGLTALYVTHDQSEALAIADRVAVMAQGRIIECAPPSRLYNRPADAATASFVGGRNMVQIKVGLDRRLRLDGRVLDAVVPEYIGDVAMVTFLPEDVMITADGVRGRVELVTFLGAVTRLRLRVGADVIDADVPSRELSHLQVGDLVAIALRADSLTVFPVPAAA
jgi:putative spermidine/putrescine transport system ATP-binding protein